MHATINVRTDRRVKARAQRVAERLGLSLDVIVNAYLQQLIRDERVSFSTTRRMSKKFAATLGPIEKDITEGRNLSPAFDTEEELRTYLSAL